MRPAHKSISAGVWKFESRLVSHFEAALFESIRTWSFDRYRFAEAHPIRSFFHSQRVVEDRDTGRSRGFAFVEMSSQEEATSAIEQFNGKEVGGRALKVNEANPRENRGGGRGFNDNRGGRYSENGRRSESRW